MHLFGDGIGSSDKKGHGEPVRFKVPPLVLQAIERTVQSHRYPYRTREDLFRDALVALLDRIQEDASDDPKISQPIRRAMVQIDLERREADRVVVDSLHRMLRDALMTAKGEEVREILSQVDEVLDTDIPDHLREQLDGLKERWGPRG